MFLCVKKHGPVQGALDAGTARRKREDETKNRERAQAAARPGWEAAPQGGAGTATCAGAGMAQAVAGAGGKGAGVRTIRSGANLRGTGISQRQQIANQVISTLCSRWSRLAAAACCSAAANLGCFVVRVSLRHPCPRFIWAGLPGDGARRFLVRTRRRTFAGRAVRA